MKQQIKNQISSTELCLLYHRADTNHEYSESVEGDLQDHFHHQRYFGVAAL